MMWVTIVIGGLSHASEIGVMKYPVIFTLLLWLLTGTTALGLPHKKHADGRIKAALVHYLTAHQGAKAPPLLYPRSVMRFYRANGFEPAWINGHGETHVWQVLLLLDCVLHYGLDHADYHPTELTYDLAHELLEHPDKVSLDRQVVYDVLLTDAMIAFTNHLHYGKLNPFYTARRIDAGAGRLKAEQVLAAALTKQNISDTILAMQPRSTDYMWMQRKMTVYTGQYSGDCYEVPEAAIRKIAINMERLRWAQMDEVPYILINIPSHTLELHERDTIFAFRIVSGSSRTPTPTFNSVLSGISILKTTMIPAENGSGKRLGTGLSPSITIRFDQRGARQVRSVTSWPGTNGDISVYRANRLAALLIRRYGWKADSFKFRRALKAGDAQSFKLAASMPLKVTYLTCIVRKGEVFTWPDIYRRDQSLEQALYHNTLKQPLK